MKNTDTDAECRRLEVKREAFAESDQLEEELAAQELDSEERERLWTDDDNDDSRITAEARAFVDAVRACLPDLKHYAATHGPGPDKRLATLRKFLESS